MDEIVNTTHAGHGDSLEEVRQRFKCWRVGRGRGELIHRESRVGAVAIAREPGPSIAARALQVDFDHLKRGQQEQEAAGGALPASRGGEQFVELPHAPNREPPARVLCECAIEFENMRGVRMRVEPSGQGPVDSVWKPIRSAAACSSSATAPVPPSNPRLRRPGFPAVQEAFIERALCLLARRHGAEPGTRGLRVAGAADG
ncbi:MAG TPA: hypothetical protein PK201_10850 [Accumulibacter sp.]|nr:hypothetical protein [Accumulibacter sp.]